MINIKKGKLYVIDMKFIHALIAIAIIVVFAVLNFSVLNKAKVKTKDIKNASNLKQINLGTKLYIQDLNSTFPLLRDGQIVADLKTTIMTPSNFKYKPLEWLSKHLGIPVNLRIENSVLFQESKRPDTLFHPKATLDTCKDILIMTIQTIGGSDYFGPVQVCYSKDKGINWSKPKAIPTLGWQESEQIGIVEGVCDVVPDYHAKSGKILAIGHNVYYKGGKFHDTSAYPYKDGKPSLLRFSVYSVIDSDGNWGPRQRIHFEEFENCSSFVCGSTQKTFRSDGKMIIPFYIKYRKRQDYVVCSLLCDFDGYNITTLRRGNILENPVGRGLLEPSICQFENLHYMTLRAEDDCGYVTVSNDGLNWNKIKPWQWNNNGDKLTMASTQQHWLTLGGKLYLVYTRKTEFNAKVLRWRSPMFIAEVDTDTLCLKSETEQTVFPMRGNPDKPNTVALMGNFMPLALSRNEAIITDGDVSRIDYSGKILLARLFSD